MAAVEVPDAHPLQLLAAAQRDHLDPAQDVAIS
jgi:hypothetical protein